jgi:hypothetical protein
LERSQQSGDVILDRASGADGHGRLSASRSQLVNIFEPLSDVAETFEA